MITESMSSLKENKEMDLLIIFFSAINIAKN